MKEIQLVARITVVEFKKFQPFFCNEYVDFFFTITKLGAGQFLNSPTTKRVSLKPELKLLLNLSPLELMKTIP